jgi:hypothetical protein
MASITARTVRIANAGSSLVACTRRRESICCWRHGQVCRDSSGKSGNSSLPARTKGGTRLTWAELVDSCLRVTDADAQPIWIDSDWLAERGVGTWMELPLWLHGPESAGMMYADVSRALAAGLAFRPLDDVVRGTLELAETTDNAGMKPERERELIEAWRRG